jgi:polyhydroxybutyrate depolymerase
MMKSVVMLAVAALCVEMPVAASDPPAGAIESRTIEVGGVERSYLLWRPAVEGSEPAPMVLVLHGGGGTAEQMRRVGFEEVATEHGFVLAYPQGIGNGWTDGRDGETIIARTGNADDVSYFRELIDHLIGERIADPDRIYVTGMSNGGIMALTLACRLSGRIAAVAAVAAGLPANAVDACRPERPVATMIVAGTEDRVVPYDGGAVLAGPGDDGGRVASAEATAELWRRLDGCEGEPERFDLPDNDPTDGTQIHVTRWPECRAGSEVALYTVEGGGHRWPGSAKRIYDGERGRITGISTQDMDGIDVVWSFFAANAKQ